MSTDTREQVKRWDGRDGVTAASILLGCGELGPVIAADTDEMEREQQLTEQVTRALKDVGVFSIGFPAIWGGPEMRVDDQIRMIETLARFDGSVGWNTTIMADSGLYAGRMSRAIAEEIYPSMDMPTAGSFNPPAKAEEVQGGYRLSGRWRFGTGVRNADRILGRFQRWIDDEPQLDANGHPDLWIAWFPPDQVTRHDTWHTTGLAGSGSCDYSIDGVIVSEHQMYPYADQFHPSQDLPPLSRYYGTLTGNQVGVPLGIARHALDELRASLMNGKSKWGVTVKAQQYVQIRYARAEGLYRTARAYALDTFFDISDSLFANEPLTAEQQADMQTAPVIACELCRESLDIVMDLVGATSILRSKPFDRMYRDMSTLARHFYFRDIHLELSGKHLLDEPIDLSLSD